MNSRQRAWLAFSRARLRDTDNEQVRAYNQLLFALEPLLWFFEAEFNGHRFDSDTDYLNEVFRFLEETTDPARPESVALAPALRARILSMRWPALHFGAFDGPVAAVAPWAWPAPLYWALEGRSAHDNDAPSAKPVLDVLFALLRENRPDLRPFSWHHLSATNVCQYVRASLMSDAPNEAFIRFAFESLNARRLWLLDSRVLGNDVQVTAENVRLLQRIETGEEFGQAMLSRAAYELAAAPNALGVAREYARACLTKIDEYMGWIREIIESQEEDEETHIADDLEIADELNTFFDTNRRFRSRGFAAELVSVLDKQYYWSAAVLLRQMRRVDVYARDVTLATDTPLDTGAVAETTRIGRSTFEAIAVHLSHVAFFNVANETIATFIGATETIVALWRQMLLLQSPRFTAPVLSLGDLLIQRRRETVIRILSESDDEQRRSLVNRVWPLMDWTLLNIACGRGDVALVRLLISRSWRADVNLQCPLLDAYWAQRPDIFELLLVEGKATFTQNVVDFPTRFVSELALAALNKFYRDYTGRGQPMDSGQLRTYFNNRPLLAIMVITRGSVRSYDDRKRFFSLLFGNLDADRRPGKHELTPLVELVLRTEPRAGSHELIELFLEHGAEFDDAVVDRLRLQNYQPTTTALAKRWEEAQAAYDQLHPRPRARRKLDFGETNRSNACHGRGGHRRHTGAH